MLNIETYFCDAYASWQKGGVENSNGRIRRWLPNRIDLSTVTEKEIDDIVMTMNLTLGDAWDTNSLASNARKQYQINSTQIRLALHFAVETAPYFLYKGEGYDYGIGQES